MNLPRLCACFPVVLGLAMPLLAQAPQRLRIDHFVQRGTSCEAALSWRESIALRICCGGAAEAFAGKAPAQEVLQQWLQGTDVIAASAADLPFWASAPHDSLALCATNVRDRDGLALGRPFVVKSAGNTRVAVFAVVTGSLPQGFTAEDPAAAVRAALPAAQKDSDAALVVVDGDFATARALLAACPGLAGAIVTGERRCSPALRASEGRFLVQSPPGGTALGQLSLLWDGKALHAESHRFAPVFLDAAGQEQEARLRKALSPEVPAEDDAGMQAHGLAGVGIDGARVNEAIERGAAFLQKQLATERASGARLGSDQSHVLMALALVHAGVHERNQDFDRELRRYLQEREVSTLGVYQAGLYCMLIEAYGRPEFYGRLRAAARYLVEGQSARGSWGYSPAVDPALCNDPDRTVLQVSGGVALSGTPEPVPEWQRQTPWNAHEDGDNSVSQFALLGLRSAQNCSVPVPKETWQRAAGWYQRGQRQGGTHGYQLTGSDGYGSMTLAGICGLAITAHELGNKDFAKAESVRKGLGWMRAHFAVDKNPESGSYLFYYLYSLERTGRILDREVLCGREWYALGVQHLLALQKADGSWDNQAGGELPPLATSFALLFLTRSTQQLAVELKRGGSGNLLTHARAAPGSRLYVILDASGSMLETMQGRTKFELAREAVEEVLATLPPGPQVALRVYGHRKRSVDQGAENDTELLLPFQPFDREVFFAKLRSLRARGRTPLHLSLTEALKDLKGGGSGPTSVVLLTDGGDDCRRDPVPAAAELGKAGVRLHVVGFDIQREDWQRQLRAMAEKGHGDYFPCAGVELASELRAAVLQAPAGFKLCDDAGAVVKEARFGETLHLPEGHYRLETRFSGTEFAASFWINTEATTAVVFDGSAAMAVRQGASGELLCPSCQKPVAKGAKFCGQCGGKLEGR
jgi:hypothetical protein